MQIVDSRDLDKGYPINVVKVKDEKHGEVLIKVDSDNNFFVYQ